MSTRLDNHVQNALSRPLGTTRQVNTVPGVTLGPATVQPGRGSYAVSGVAEVTLWWPRTWVNAVRAVGQPRSTAPTRWSH
jgi:hypothetical protein